jgi:hypothetical protein
MIYGSFIAAAVASVCYCCVCDRRDITSSIQQPPTPHPQAQVQVLRRRRRPHTPARVGTPPQESQNSDSCCSATTRTVLGFVKVVQRERGAEGAEINKKQLSLVNPYPYTADPNSPFTMTVVDLLAVQGFGSHSTPMAYGTPSWALTPKVAASYGCLLYPV